NNLKLFIPTGYQPLDSNQHGITVTEKAEGFYQLSLTQEKDEVVLPMTLQLSQNLNAADLEVLKAPIGVKDSEWPKDVEINLLGKNFGSVTATAEAVANFLSSNYLYSKKATATDPIDALNAGQFKCDMAALTMVGLMRDHFKMPCRPVAGYRSSK